MRTLRLHRRLPLSVLALLLPLPACREHEPAGPELVTPVFASTGGLPRAAKLCYKEGWTTLVRADDSSFAGEGDCISYVAMGAKFGQTVSFTSVNPSPVQINAASYAPQATASSGLPVTIGLDAASAGCSLANGVVSFTAAGTCLVNANQAGNELWAAATQAQQSITVNRKSQTISFTSVNPSPVHAGAPDYSPQASATSGLAVTFALDASSTGCSLASGVVSFNGAGSCVINADQAGDATWAPAPQVQQTVAVTVDPSAYCTSIGGSFGGETVTALWTCDDWEVDTESEAREIVEPLAQACRADNGATSGGFDYGTTDVTATPIVYDARCHLPAS